MDGLFLLAVALEAIPVALFTFYDRPARGRDGSRRLGRANLRGFNCCQECGVPLPVAVDATWRLAGTCDRCGTLQEWAAPHRNGPAPAVEPWQPIKRVEAPRPRLTPRTVTRPAPARSAPPGRPAPLRPAAGGGVPAGGVPPRGVHPRAGSPRGIPPQVVPTGGGPSRGTPIPPRVPPRPTQDRPAREAAPVDPFVSRPAARADTGPSESRVQRRGMHRPRPERRGFRRENAISRVSAALGQKGFNCCEECGDPLPREPDREWRYAGTCPRCGHVQVWAT
jgi:RNA polymerase-binding transcription factor DksA